MNHSDPPGNDAREHPISRNEFWAVVTITLLGAAVRFAFPSAMAIEHFDEGVYASNLLFPDQGYRYPDRHLYAPSLVPALIEWSIILFGDKGIAPMLPSLLFGTLTIPLLWWVGRQWFGPLSGITAATLLSLSDFHIAFSRSALTDVPLCFWLLLAVYLFERSFRDLSWPTAIAAGLITGLAWWTKYNGWLPLAISLSGLLAWSLFARRDERHFLLRFSLWVIAAATAIAGWSPYLLTLPHGYVEVARNHSQYVVGFAGWRIGFRQHLDSWSILDGGISASVAILAAALTAGAIIVVSREEAKSATMLFARWPLNAARISVGLSVFGTLASYCSAEFALMILGGALLLIWLAKALKYLLAASGAMPFKIHDLVLAAWVVGLIVTTPLYRPYPRLGLPLVIGIHLLSSRWMGELFVRPRMSAFKRTNGWTAMAVVAAALIAVSLTFGSRRPSWQSLKPRNDLAHLARLVGRDAFSLSQSAVRNPTTIVSSVFYVYAEPGLFFHLPADGLAVQPAGNLSFVDIEATRRLPTFLVTGPHAHRSQAFADEFAKRADQFELIASYPYDASDFVRLDDVSATQLRAHREPLEVRLYRVRVPE